MRRASLATLLSLALSVPLTARVGEPAQAQADSLAAARSKSGQLAETLFSALKRKDYAAAFQLFDEKMKAAVPEEKLATLWTEQIASLGEFQEWHSAAGPPAQGYDLTLASLKFERGELKAAVYIDPKANLVSGFYVKPAATPSASPAAYVDTTRFHAVDLPVGSDPFVLSGTLTVPTGPGPFPGVVLVHGSGPQDRDETIGANKVFKDLAEGLSSRGIAVLRYEKRTKQYGARMTDSTTLEDEVLSDAIAAVQALRARREVDARRAFVVGHSLGALLAPEIAVRSGSVAGVVLLAPPGRPPWDLILAQMRYLERPPEELAETERKVALLQQGKLGSEKLLNVSQSYWQDWAKRDGVAMAKKLGRPVLILRGDRDFQVADEDIETWRRGLAGTSNVEIVTIPGLNHLFIEGTGKPNVAEYDMPGHVDVRVIDKIAAFMAPRPAPASSPKR